MISNNKSYFLVDDVIRIACLGNELKAWKNFICADVRTGLYIDWNKQSNSYYGIEVISLQKNIIALKKMKEFYLRIQSGIELNYMRTKKRMPLL